MPFYIASNEIMEEANCFKVGYSESSEIILLKQYRTLYYPMIYCWIAKGDRQMEREILKKVDKYRLLNGENNQTEWVMMNLPALLRIVADYIDSKSVDESKDESVFEDPVFPDFSTYVEPPLIKF